MQLQPETLASALEAELTSEPERLEALADHLWKQLHDKATSFRKPDEDSLHVMRVDEEGLRIDRLYEVVNTVVDTDRQLSGECASNLGASSECGEFVGLVDSRPSVEGALSEIEMVVFQLPEVLEWLDEVAERCGVGGLPRVFVFRTVGDGLTLEAARELLDDVDVGDEISTVDAAMSRAALTTLVEMLPTTDYEALDSSTDKLVRLRDLEILERSMTIWDDLPCCEPWSFERICDLYFGSDRPENSAEREAELAAWASARGIDLPELYRAWSRITGVEERMRERHPDNLHLTKPRLIESITGEQLLSFGSENQGNYRLALELGQADPPVWMRWAIHARRSVWMMYARRLSDYLVTMNVLPQLLPRVDEPPTDYRLGPSCCTRSKDELFGYTLYYRDDDRVCVHRRRPIPPIGAA